MLNQTLRIGEVAAQAGVNVQTLRYYERRGLLKDPPRHYTGERRYAPETVDLIRSIKRAQALGFTLEEIDDLLAASARNHRGDLAVATAAVEKLQEVDARIADLHVVRTRLAEVVERGCNSITKCECGQCPISDAPPPANRGEEATADSPPQLQAASTVVNPRSLRRFIPASVLAVVACLACLAPSFVLGGLGGLSIVGMASTGAWGLAGFAVVGAVIGGAATALIRLRRHGANCGCGKP